MWIDWSPRQSKSLPWVMVMEIMSQPCAFMGHGFHSKLLSCRRVWMEIILYDNVQQVFSTCWNRSWILNISEPPHEKWFRVPWSTNIMFFLLCRPSWTHLSSHADLQVLAIVFVQLSTKLAACPNWRPFRAIHQKIRMTHEKTLGYIIMDCDG